SSFLLVLRPGGNKMRCRVRLPARLGGQFSGGPVMSRCARLLISAAAALALTALLLHGSQSPSQEAAKKDKDSPGKGKEDPPAIKGPSTPAAELPRPPTAEEIAKWIKDLGDLRFPVRERATRSLEAAGPAAVKPLAQAMQSTDPEVQRRARQIS